MTGLPAYAFAACMDVLNLLLFLNFFLSSIPVNSCWRLCMKGLLKLALPQTILFGFQGISISYALFSSW